MICNHTVVCVHLCIGNKVTSMHWTLPLVAYATVDNLLEFISTMKQCCCARMCPHVNEAFQLFTKYTCHLVGLVLVVANVYLMMVIPQPLSQVVFI